jgi:hypothetical protein
MENPRYPPCPICRIELQPIGQIPVRTGGTSGGWHLFLGDLADAGERMLYFDTYRCPKCRRLEFYDHDASLPQR